MFFTQKEVLMTDQVTSPAATPKSGRALHITLWIVQILLAIAFGFAGVLKSTQPIAALGKNMPWALVVPAALVRFIGISELLGALGLVLPSITRVLPGLTAWAGAGLTTIMVLAMGFHISRGEFYGITSDIDTRAAFGFCGMGKISQSADQIKDEGCPSALRLGSVQRFAQEP
jgi:putative oxidoreductase